MTRPPTLQDRACWMLKLLQEHPSHVVGKFGGTCAYRRCVASPNSSADSLVPLTVEGCTEIHAPVQRARSIILRFSWGRFRRRRVNSLSSTAVLHNRIADRPSLMTEVCSAPLHVTLFLSDAIRCPHPIVDAPTFPPALVVSLGIAIPSFFPVFFTTCFCR